MMCLAIVFFFFTSKLGPEAFCLPLFTSKFETQQGFCTFCWGVVVAFVCLLFLNMNIVSCVVVAFVFVVVVGVVVCVSYCLLHAAHISVDSDVHALA